ncbi:MAG: hypothetical protein NC394_01065 [Bacteroides sp.]|nr:hypothetical protein [Bacteroides sp.]
MICFLSLFFFSVSAFAESDALSENANANLLAEYASAEWTGDPLYLDEPSAAVYFKSRDSREQSAALTFERNEADTGFYFRIDAGNGANSGGDSGCCTISFFDEEKNLLFSLSTGLIKNFDNYSRFYIGEETSYFPIPEKAKTVEITLNAEQNGKSGRVNIYFRNPVLYMSGEQPLLPYENKTYLESAAGLAKVEIGVTKATRYIWIGIVFVVALVFYIIRMWRQKYSTARVMTAYDRRPRK